MTGIITSIQSMCFDDGPGLRTTVFFKGCPLRCFWCHNPESLEQRSQMAWYRSQCVDCGNCIQVCPRNARKQVGLPDEKQCVQCGDCVEACPGYAIERIGTQWEVGTLADRLARDRAFFENSGGGVTLSGGEPLQQWQFAAALVAQLKSMGIHTAIETSGFAAPKAFAEVVNLLDLVIMDIKHPDADAHLQATGQRNEPILANFHYLCQTGKPCIIRTPVIPGVNDDENTIREIARIAAKAPGLMYYELMPYHPLGTGKLESLGMKERFGSVLVPPAPEHMEALRNAGREAGIIVK